MKFTDGYWMMREGVRAHYAAQAYDGETDERSLTVFAAPRPIRHRGDTVQGPLLTIRMSSPMPDVARVRISHFEGGDDRKPQFTVYEDPDNRPLASVSDDRSTLTAGDLAVN